MSVTAKGVVSQQDQENILRAKADVDRATRAYEDAIRAASNNPDQRASIRALADFTDLAPGTISRILRGE